jgi:enoyl-CoA hydratase/carnithine racemase
MGVRNAMNEEHGRTTSGVPKWRTRGRYDDLRVEVDRHVASVVLDRPPGNELVPTTMLEIRDAVTQLSADDDVRCIVLTGAGRSFSRGADLTRDGLIDERTGRVDRAEIARLRAVHRRERGLETRDLLESPLPIIAAINGAAAGGGLTLALQADIRIMAEDAKVSFAFARRGLTPEMGATWLLPRVVGVSTAMELMLTGRAFDGHEAERIGFARAVPREDVLTVTLQLAHRIASETSPLAVAAIKQMLWANGTASSYVRATRHERDVIDWITAQPDAAEGLRSFVEKRPPVWTTTGREPLPGFVPSLFETVVDEY